MWLARRAGGGGAEGRSLSPLSPLLVQGGDGVISVTANVAPAAVAAVMSSGRAGDAAAALALDGPLMALHRDLFCEANPIPVKWALHKMGRMGEGIRSPLSLIYDFI